MGATLDTPARCPLCNQQTREPVTLKCNHRFCQRCIGDLWSVTPTGPFHCPEWKCKTVYLALPFDSSLIWPPAAGRRAQPPSAAGTSSKDDQDRFDSALRRPSITSRLLGKRKASTSVAEQPDKKRSTKESSCERSTNVETPSTSLPDTPGRSTGVEAAMNGVMKESTQSGCADGAASSDNHVDNPQPKDVIPIDDSDSSSEVDICDAPPIVTPKVVAGVHELAPKPASPAKSDSSAGVSTAGKNRSPMHHVSKTPPTFTKSPAASSGSPSPIGAFARPEIKNSGPVPCHYCPKTVHQPAVKTCLVCGASMCAEHLRPHMESPVFQSHTLAPPVEDISLWRCQEHHEMNRIYCRQCAVCVCTVCTVIGSHRDHVCISIREAERELRGNLKEEIKELQMAENQVKERLTELTQKKEASRAALSDTRAAVQQQYGAISEALQQEEQSALECVTKEERRVLGGLEEKLDHLQNSLQSIHHGLHVLETLADAKGEKRIQDQVFIMEYSKVSQLASEMGSCVDQFEPPEEVDQAKLKCLQTWTEKRLDTVVITKPNTDRDLYRLLHGIIPCLDADTAHPKLQLSDNNRKVTYNEAQQGYTEQEARFSSFPQVLASNALECGRWYWEVNVSVDDGRWKVGLCEGQMERKGQKDNCRLGCNAHSWCLAYDRRKVEALHNKVAVPVAAERLQRVGVFLDSEEGVLSFFAVTPGGSLALLHSYKHCFTDPLYPALSVSKTQLAICDLFQ